MATIKVGEYTLEETADGLTLSIPVSTPLRVVWKAGRIEDTRGPIRLRRVPTPKAKKPRRKMKPRVQLNDEQKAMLVGDLIGGMRTIDAAKKYSISTSTVNDIRKAAIKSSHAKV